MMTHLKLPMNVEDLGMPVSLTYLRTLPTHVPFELRLVVTVGTLILLQDELVYRVCDSVVAVAVNMVYVLVESRSHVFSR